MEVASILEQVQCGRDAALGGDYSSAIAHYTTGLAQLDRWVCVGVCGGVGDRAAVSRLWARGGAGASRLAARHGGGVHRRRRRRRHRTRSGRGQQQGMGIPALRSLTLADVVTNPL